MFFLFIFGKMGIKTLIFDWPAVAFIIMRNRTGVVCNIETYTGRLDVRDNIYHQVIRTPC